MEPIICHVVKVSDDLQCHTTIYGKTIPMYSIRSVLSVTELISLLKCVEEAVVCFGNSDSFFITICSDRNGELCNRSGWLMLLYTYSIHVDDIFGVIVVKLDETP